MIIKYHVDTPWAECTIDDEVEVPDGATDEEIDEYVREEIFNVIEWSWIKAKEDSDE